MHFDCWSEACISRRLLKAFWLIWHAAVWSIWKERNARIFKNQAKHVDEVVDEIKVLSWYWTMSRLRTPPCLFYEWTWNPKECMNRRHWGVSCCLFFSLSSWAEGVFGAGSWCISGLAACFYQFFCWISAVFCLFFFPWARLLVDSPLGFFVVFLNCCNSCLFALLVQGCF